MELDAFTQHVHDQLTAAAALGDERTREIATALAATARSSVRLAILDALSAAAAEITDALYAGGDGGASPAVTVHLDAPDTVRFSVSGPPSEPAEPMTPNRVEDGDATARISLRLSDSLKSDIEKAAAAADVSVNSWLVRAAASALRTGSGDGNWSGAGHQYGRGAQRITGWVTG